MRGALHVLLLACGIAGTAYAQNEPLLQLQGQPYAGGQMSLHLSGDVGKQAFVLYGLNPLDPPLQLSKGAYHLGWLANIVPLGMIPSSGRIDVSFVVPPLHPSLAGIPLVIQGYVTGALSNPATLPLDQPYLTPPLGIVILPPSPAQGAHFGDRVHAGDFDGDGFTDLAVGAAFENFQGVQDSGSVYVVWGPTWSDSTVLRPPSPGARRLFGYGIAVADVDQDGKDDIAITENAADPPLVTDSGHVYVCFGNAGRSLTYDVIVASPGPGIEAASFGRGSSSGDVTGDGIPDFVIGAEATSGNGAIFVGAVMVLAGPAVDSPIIIPNPSPFLGDFFGNSLSVADVNGDYFLDIVEGSGRADVVSLNTGSPIVNAGEVHVLYGPLFQSWEALHSPLAVGFEARFGDIVAAYDVDGDGSAEILTTDANNWGCLVSAVAKTVVTVPKPPALLENPFGETAYGYSVGFCDANGDGLQDLLIGDAFDGSLAPCSISSTGLVYAILAPYFSTYAVVETASASCGAEFGWTTDVHDVDGDGVLDLIVGAPLSDNAGPINSGMVVIFLGG